jgi:hypothetical protein
LHKYKYFVIVPVIFVFLLVGKASGEKSRTLTFRAGLGYDFVSQENFIDSVRLGGADSILELSLLEKDYLDDKKAILSVEYNPDQKGRYILAAGWEQTPNIIRASGRGLITLGNYTNQLLTEFNIDVKERYRGTIEMGEEMTVINGTVRYKKRLSSMFDSRIRLFGESVDFDSTGSYIYNYSRLGGDLEFNLLTHDFNSIYTKFGAEKRNVPDSGQLDYLLIRGSAGYLGSLFGSYMVSELTIEKKDYKQVDDLNDHTLVTFQSDMRFPLGKEFQLKTDVNIENYDFKAENSLSDDYFLARTGLLLGWENGGFSLSLGPKIELLEIESEYENDDDYFEFFGFAEIDYYRPEKVFLLLDNQMGRRTYKNNPLFYSDFIFDRVSLIGNITITRRLSADILFSADWEWHRVESDDSRLYLLSSSLTYSF